MIRLGDEKLKNGLGECQVILVAEGKYFLIYILKLLLVVLCTSGNVSWNIFKHYMGLQKHKKKYLFLMISLNYKCSKDAKTGLGLVRECLVQGEIPVTFLDQPEGQIYPRSIGCCMV